MEQRSVESPGYRVFRLSLPGIQGQGKRANMSFRQDVKDLAVKVSGHLQIVERDQNTAIRSLGSKLDQLRDDLDQGLRKQPLQVKLTRKQVDQVIQRLNDPLVFPREITEFIAGDIARHGNVFYQWQMSYHPLGFTAEVEFRTDGTMKLSFSDASGQRFWTGVWHGVDG